MTVGKKLIPDEIREKVLEEVEKFNQLELKGINVRYIAKFQGRFLYLDREAYSNRTPLIRMEYFRKSNKWKFAIFKWSKEFYDPDDRMFPGSNFVDGTIVGAMRAGLRAYPV